MPYLYIVLLGGKHPRARIEVHDIVACIAPSLEETYTQLRNDWFGDPKHVHIDAWMRIEGIDGYRLHFSQQASKADALKLYLINLGGYLPQEFGEAHRYVLVTAHSAHEAKQKGKLQLIPAWEKAHTDAVIDVDDCLPLDHINGRYIYLEEGPYNPVHFANDYRVLS